MLPRPPWACPQPGHCEYASEDRQSDQSCSLCAPHQLAFDRPGISPRLAASRSLVRANPNLRYTPRERPVIEQRLRCRDAAASRGWRCSSACAASRPSAPVFGSRISSLSSARRAAYFFAILRRFFSRMSMFVLAMSYTLLTERKIEGFQKRAPMFVVVRRRGDGYVHATNLIDLVVLNLGEDDLLFDAQAVIAAAVEGSGADAAKVPDAGNRNAHETIQKLVHAVAAQGHLAADGLAVAHLERGNRLLRLGDRRLLPGDLRHVGGRGVHDLLVGHSLAHAHVDRDLEDARNLHRVLEPELFLELRHELVVVNLFQSGCHVIYSLTGRTYLASTISLFDLNTRTLRPFSSALKPTRSPFCVAGLKTSTLDTCSGASRSMMPP